MKKTIIKGVALIIVAVVLLVGVFYSCGFEQYIPEIPSRLARHHNTGEINVTMDGKEISIDGTQLSFICDTGEAIDTTIIENGNFKFKDGVYGMNIFEFEINETEFSPVKVSFGHFNTNWWHVVDYKIDLNLSQNHDESYTVKTKYEIAYKDGALRTSEDTCVINEENKVIDLFNKGLIE